jgi:rod shape-determining protein MreD
VSTAARIAAIIFTAAILQVTLVNSFVTAGGTADVLLVVVVAIALLRGSITGAVAGFAGGLLVDVATLGTLGVNALLLAVAGYWAGRYGETTGRDRAHAPVLAVGAITIGVGLAGYLLHFMLGDDVSARLALVTALVPALVLNLLLCVPVYAACRALVGPASPPRRSREVELYV